MPENLGAERPHYVVERSIDQGRLRSEANQADPRLAALLGDLSLVQYAASGLWEFEAACSKPEVKINFFPEKISPKSLQAKIIRAVCNSCPVKDACRVAAFLSIEQDGVWGGLFPSERIETPAGQKSLARKSQGKNRLEQQQRICYNNLRVTKNRIY